MSPYVYERWPYAGALALLASACAGGNAEAPVSSTTTTEAPLAMPAELGPMQSMRQAPPLVVQGDDAAAQIASARCIHEEACDHIGADRAYASFDDCIGRLRVEHLQRLSGQVCARGVDPYVLSECVADLRTEACGEPRPPASCGRERLCR